MKSTFEWTRFLFVAFCLTAMTGSVYANLVLDGGFEAPGVPAGTHSYGTGPLGAWAVSIASGSSPAGVYTAGAFIGANVTEGEQAFDIGMGGYPYGNSISQTLAMTAGWKYSLTFDWGSEYDWGTQGLVMVGDLSETLIDVGTGSASEMGTWLQHSASFEFVAAGNDVLTFTDLSPQVEPTWRAGLVLDNIAVEAIGPAVPAPGALLLGSLGTACLGWLRRRRTI